MKECWTTFFQKINCMINFIKNIFILCFFCLPCGCNKDKSINQLLISSNKEINCVINYNKQNYDRDNITGVEDYVYFEELNVYPGDTIIFHFQSENKMLESNLNFWIDSKYIDYNKLNYNGINLYITSDTVGDLYNTQLKHLKFLFSYY